MAPTVACRGDAVALLEEGHRQIVQVTPSSLVHLLDNDEAVLLASRDNSTKKHATLGPRHRDVINAKQLCDNQI